MKIKMGKLNIYIKPIISILFALSFYSCADSTADKIDTFLTHCFENNQFNGALLVSKDGNVIYQKVFGRVNLRLIYYHLSKGVELGIFNVKEVQKIEGDYSWGPDAKRIIFTLTNLARPKGSLDVGNKIQEMNN